MIYIHRLQFFKDVKHFRILVCGGDGTVGWLLEAMGRYPYLFCIKKNMQCMHLTRDNVIYNFCTFKHHIRNCLSREKQNDIIAS